MSFANLREVFIPKVLPVLLAGCVKNGALPQPEGAVLAQNVVVSGAPTGLQSIVDQVVQDCNNTIAVPSIDLNGALVNGPHAGQLIVAPFYVRVVEHDPASVKSYMVVRSGQFDRQDSPDTGRTYFYQDPLGDLSAGLLMERGYTFSSIDPKSNSAHAVSEYGTPVDVSFLQGLNFSGGKIIINDLDPTQSRCIIDVAVESSCAVYTPNDASDSVVIDCTERH